MFFIAYAFKGQLHAFAGRVKIVSHSSCRTSAILKYFLSLEGTALFIHVEGLFIYHKQLTLILPVFFIPENIVCFYICCIDFNAFQTPDFILEANVMFAVYAS